MVIADHVLQTCSVQMNKKLKGISPTSRELLLRYSFPGYVERARKHGRAGGRWDATAKRSSRRTCAASVVSVSGRHDPGHLWILQRGFHGAEGAERPLNSLMRRGEEFEKEYILSVLEQVQGSRTTASKILGLSRKALWEKCKRYGIPSAKGEPERGRISQG